MSTPPEALPKPIDLAAMDARIVGHIRESVRLFEDALKQLDAQRADVQRRLDTARHQLKQFEQFKNPAKSAASTTSPKSSAGSAADVIRVLEKHRGRKMSATQIQQEAGSALRVRYLVGRHKGNPKIHVHGSKRGKVYWMD